MQALLFSPLAELAAAVEDVGIGDDPLRTDVLHLGRCNQQEMRIDHREERRRPYRLIAGFQASGTAGDVLIKEFEMESHGQSRICALSRVPGR
jgi:hypothetical protein